MDAEVFSTNLRGLLLGRKMSQKELAYRIGGETESERHSYYRWLRRTVSKGLTRCEDRNRKQLQRICDFFGVHPVERLWSPSFAKTQNLADEHVAMLRYILQATTPLDGEGRMAHIVDSTKLTDQIRKAYGLLLEDQRIKAHLRSLHRNRDVPPGRPTEAVEEEATSSIDAEVTPFAESRGDDETLEDFLVRRSLMKLRDDVRNTPDAGGAHLLRQAGRRLPGVIRDCLPIDIDPAMAFEQAWQTFILPALRALRKELRDE